MALRIGEETIRTTAGHPIWVVDGVDLADRPRIPELGCDATDVPGRWVYALHLEVGDSVDTPDGPLTIAGAVVSRESLVVYNLSVEGTENYTAGAVAVWVHNTSGDPTDPCGCSKGGGTPDGSPDLPGSSGWDDHKWGDTSTAPCFPIGTPVHTPAGERSIDEIKEGDMVLSYDFERGGIAYRRVRACFLNWTQTLVRISLPDDEILATRNHPFWSPSSNAWVAACRLQRGDELLLVTGKSKAVESVESVATEESTYNFEVDGLHNYFVGREGVLVHNSDFAVTNKTSTQIYEVLDRSDNVVYVGRTIQGIDVRYQQHLGKGHPHWKNGYKVRLVQEGSWTPYEAAVWEQHYIDLNGGKDSLENAINGISESKYNDYKHLHDPC